MKVEKYEIDMLGVGAADAMLIRFFDEKDLQYVVLVDAGNISNGKQICDFVRERYNTYKIDLAICTHCDDDHFGGFIYIVQDMISNPDTSVDIKRFVINDPGNHITELDVKWYEIRENVQKEARSVYTSGGINLLDLIREAEKLGRLESLESFSDRNWCFFDGIIETIGPSTSYYKEKALQFRNKLQPYDYDVDNDDDDAQELPNSSKVYSKTLDEAGDDSSAHNQSSIIFLFKPEDDKLFLFTGDAGDEAFDRIMYQSDKDKIKNIYWLKIPHHGSKKNMSNDMINHLRPKVAYVSTEKYTHYLSKAVVSALRKVGCRVYSTNNSTNVWHHHNMPERDDYSKAEPLK